MEDFTKFCIGLVVSTAALTWFVINGESRVYVAMLAFVMGACFIMAVVLSPDGEAVA